MKSLRNRLLLGIAILFAARLALSAIRSGPVLVADEIGYLTDARVLAGELPGQLHLAPFYRGGYSLAIAPLIELGLGPSATYHLVLGLNAALAAAVFPLLYVLLSRFLGLAERIALPAAFVGALYPALTALSQVAMSENALFPLVCVWLIAIAGLLSARGGPSSLRWGVATGASTAALWLVHNRMIVAVALTALLIAWLGLRRRISPTTLFATFATLAAGMLATHFLDSFVIDHNYGGDAGSEVSERLHDVANLSDLGNVALNLVGQTWYLIASTFGLVAVVAAEAATRVRRAGSVGRALCAGNPGALLALLALTAMLLVISAAAFPERTRPDMLIYGRYVEVVAPAVIAIGLALATDRAWRPALVPAALAFLALSAAVVAIRIVADDPGAPNRWNITGLPFVTAQLGAPILIGGAVIALAGASLLAIVCERRPAALPLAAATLFLPIVLYGAWNPVRSSQLAAYPSGWTSPEAVATDREVKVAAYDLDSYDALGLYPLQWFLPDTRILLFHGTREKPPAGFVIGSRGWAKQHPSPPPTLLWHEVGRDQALWEIDTAEGRR